MEAERARSYKVLNRDEIKSIAMVAMLLNHIATIFLEPGTWLREIFVSIGYFTAISMVCFLVEGYCLTRSRKRYFARLFLFAVISEIPFCLAFTQGGVLAFYGFNMLFTLCLCFGILWALEHVKNRALRVGAVMLGLLLSLFCDWALLAPVFTLLFAWAKGSEKRLKRAFVFATLLFGALNLLSGAGRYSFGVNVGYALLSMLGMGAAGVCIVFFYNGAQMKAGRSVSKWFFYAFYPAHLLVLGLLRIGFGM